MSMNGRERDPMLDSHEDRLQSVEEASKELSTQVATIAANQESMSRRVDEGFKNIMEKIDMTIAPLTQKVEDRAEASALGRRDLDKMTEKVEVLNQDRLKKAQHDATLKKVATALAIGIASVLGKELAVKIFMHLVQ
jgi:hypothetical protein